MPERWCLQDSGLWLTPEAAVAAVGDRLDRGELTTWFESDAGRVMCVVTNRQRAMVMILNGEGDAGEHAVDHDAAGFSSGYVLDNGQVDTYEDRDTVPLSSALRAVERIVITGLPPAFVDWVSDR